MYLLSAYWPYLFILLIPLPIGTDRRRRRFPWATTTLIVINVVVFIASQNYIHTHPGADIYGEYGFLPAAPRLSSLITSMFLHVSVPHIFWNMAFLWLFGSHVEDALGPISFLALYFGGGLAAGMLHTAIKWLVPGQQMSLQDPLVGASGAISAVIAPFAVRYHRAQIRLLWLPGLLARSDWAQLEVPAVAGLALWLLETLAGAIKSVLFPGSGGIAYWAHLGGFVFGLIASELGGLFREGRQEYLLQEAHRSLADGTERPRSAIEVYRSVLKRTPANVSLRSELVGALAPRHSQEAKEEIIEGIHQALAAQRWPDALRLRAEAKKWELALPPSDLLRLATAAEEMRDEAVAISILQDILQKMPDAPEDEMARLRLGQLLLKNDPAQAFALFSSFLKKYPDSVWSDRVKEMRRRAEMR